MRQLLMVMAMVLLAGCGADTLNTAATAAALKKQELEQAQKNKNRIEQRIGAATQQMEQNAQNTLEAADKE